jgi:transcriptional regulator with XRE-family HTH domain
MKKPTMESLRRLKQLRKGQGYTLKNLAEKSGLSPTYLSQIERGMSNPSIGTLKKIADAMSITIVSLLGFEETDENEKELEENIRKRQEVFVIKKEKRKMLVYPGETRKAFLLTPDLRRKLEILLTYEEPQQENDEDWYQHEGEEFGFILEGRYEVIVEGRTYVLEEGDSIYFPSRFPHRMRCIGEKTATTIWVITPPSF